MKCVIISSIFLEALQGLSAARNRGFQEASYPWVAFIDDDSFVFPDFVERALHVINHYNFDAFGGKVFSQFEKTPPKWFPTNFEEVPIEATENPVFIEDQFFFGCVMLFRKTILQQLNGFKTAYGMSGKKIGYGEETFLQKEMQEKGYKLGFDPMLRVYHQVRADKLKLGWLLRSYYARGRDAYQIYYQQYSGQQFFTDIMMALFIILPKAIVKWIIRPTFYWQHVILEPGSAFAKALGKFCAVRSK